MALLERFSVVFEKMNEQAEAGEPIVVSYEFQDEEYDEIRRLSEVVEETRQVHYQLITTA